MNKKTPLYNEHLKLKAKMTPFAGWEMPLQYTSVKEEHIAVRTNVGIFDVSHMGQVFISGEDSFLFLQDLVPQDLSKLEESKACYAMLLNEAGGIIDDLIIYRLKDKFLLIVNASRINEDLDWIRSKKQNYNIIIDNQSDNLAMIAVQGPKSSQLIDVPLKRFEIMEADDRLIATTGYTGEDGFEIIVKNEHAIELWNELLNKGGTPIGFAARDTLRLEASLLLYGQDMDEQTNPVEASLSWTLPKEKKEEFSKNINKKLIGFKMLDKAIPRHDYKIYIKNEDVGIVTSGGFSPCDNIGIGLGYIKVDKPTDEGTKIDIMIRNKLHPAEIVKRPFYKK